MVGTVGNELVNKCGGDQMIADLIMDFGKAYMDGRIWDQVKSYFTNGFKNFFSMILYGTEAVIAPLVGAFYFSGHGVGSMTRIVIKGE